MIEVIPLGTGSALPATDRHFSATAVQHNGQLFLFDCGEGTQVRMLKAGLKMSRLQAIFITHLHGDHLFGLPGLLSTLELIRRQQPLTVVGPAGLKDFLHALPAHSPDRPDSYPMHFVELKDDVTCRIVYDSYTCQVLTRPVQHGVFTVGYRFEEKDRPGNLDVDRARALGLYDYEQYRQLKEGEPVTLPDGRTVQPDEVVGPVHRGAVFAYVTDTRPTSASVWLARRADLLYHEATFVDDDRTRALNTHHSTASEAAAIADEAGARKLIIGHFSARYDGADLLLQEARQVFQNTDAAEELKRYALPDGPQSENGRS